MKKMTSNIEKIVTRTSSALQLRPENVDFEALYEIIKYLPDDELQVLLSCFGFSTTPMSIEETAKALGIASLEVIDSLSNAFVRIESQKSTFYSGKETSEEPEVDIRAINSLNPDAYKILSDAGIKYVSELRNMSIGDFVKIPGLKYIYYENILNALRNFSFDEATIKTTLQALKELRDK